MSSVTPSSSGGIVYSCISRGNVILVQHAEASGNMENVTRKILEKLPGHKEYKMSYTHEQYVFNILIKDGITYLCLSLENFGRRRPFAFLEDITQRFVSSNGSAIQSAAQYAYQGSFGKVLKERINYYNTKPEADLITKVQTDIEDLKQVVVNNLEKVLERGEKLEVLEGKANNLNTQSNKFKKNATALKRHEWWKNCKLNIIIAIIVLVILAIIIAAICGSIKCR
eukprot:c27530_g1_i1.p1 GENE.c27530_g1_i1~~c27530_g1_i1.p1  ORF type:complete len:238 (+),score=72.62 c27530_g1_i1:37-714(+)